MSNPIIERLKLMNRMIEEGRSQEEIDLALANHKAQEEGALNEVKPAETPSLKEIYCLACRRHVKFEKYIIKQMEIKPNSFRSVLKARCPYCSSICNRILPKKHHSKILSH